MNDLKQLCGQLEYIKRWECKTDDEKSAIDKAIQMLSAEQTAEWIEVIDEIDSLGNKTWHHECSICGSEDSGWGNYKYCPNCGRRMKGNTE